MAKKMDTSRKIKLLGSEVVTAKVGDSETPLTMTISQLYKMLKESNFKIELERIDGKNIESFKINKLNNIEKLKSIMYKISFGDRDLIVSLDSLLPDGFFDDNFTEAKLADGIARAENMYFQLINNKKQPAQNISDIDTYNIKTESGEKVEDVNYGGLFLAGIYITSKHLGRVFVNEDGNQVIKVKKFSTAKDIYGASLIAINGIVDMDEHIDEYIYYTSKLDNEYEIVLKDAVWENVSKYIDTNSQGDIIPTMFVPGSNAANYLIAGITAASVFGDDIECNRDTAYIIQQLLVNSGYNVRITTQGSIGDNMHVYFYTKNTINSIIEYFPYDSSADYKSLSYVQMKYIDKQFIEENDDIFEIEMGVSDSFFVNAIAI